jgi:glycosyltransferase involved in cell wall biosynthesis
MYIVSKSTKSKGFLLHLLPAGVLPAFMSIIGFLSRPFLNHSGRTFDKKKVTIWLVNPYGPIPSENWREYAYVILGKWHASLGHNCVWWTSDYSHHFKIKRSQHSEFVSQHFYIRFLQTPSYDKNISFRRLLRDFSFYAQFLLRSTWACITSERPDCIVYTSSPLLPFLSPVIICRIFSISAVFYEMDDWLGLLRSIFRNYPPLLRPFTNLPLLFLDNAKRLELSLVDASFALSTNYLHALHKLSPSLRKKPHAVVYNSPKYDAREELSASNDSLATQLNLIKANHDLVYAIYAGSMNPTYDIESVIKCLSYISLKDPKIVLLFAGTGPLSYILDPFKNINNMLANRLFYMGSLHPRILSDIYKISDIGICSYLKDSNVDMPDKAYDYLFNSLPIVNSLQGELKYLLDEHGAGINYDSSVPSSLAESLLWLASSPDRLSMYTNKAFLLGQSLSQELQRGKYIKLFDHLL